MADVFQEAKDFAIKQLKATPALLAGGPAPRAEAIIAAMERAFLEGYARGLDGCSEALEKCRLAVLKVKG